MSKQGVTKTQEYRKPRRRVKLEERDGVVGKECTKCGEWKPLDDYHNTSHGVGNRKPNCKICRRNYHYSNREREIKRMKSWRENNREREIERCRQWYQENPNYFREYYEHNKERHSANVRKWGKENRGKKSIHLQNYRAKRNALPNTLTSDGYKKVMKKLNLGCFYNEQTINLEIDHVIPISIGHGGTTEGNCVPMTSGLNQSKLNNNVFEWFESNRQRFKLSQENFERRIEWLASANALTVQEYREFYDWCFDNPRTVDEIKRDQRHSIEIWREASGKQFPLPAYTQTYYSTESEAVS